MSKLAAGIVASVKATTAIDVWSYGALLFAMSTGRNLFPQALLILFLKSISLTSILAGHCQRRIGRPFESSEIDSLAHNHGPGAGRGDNTITATYAAQALLCRAGFPRRKINRGRRKGDHGRLITPQCSRRGTPPYTVVPQGRS